MMFVLSSRPCSRPVARAPPAADGGAIVTVTRPPRPGPPRRRGRRRRAAAGGRSARRRAPVDRPEQRVDGAVALGGRLPLVIAGRDDDRAAALDVASPTSPSSARDGASALGRRSSARLRGARCAADGPSGYLPAGAVVKWRSSRRRSSAPDFQIAYSSESARAVADAAMMFVSLPIVDHSRAPSDESMMTRVRAAVAASPSRIRTL